MANKHSRPSNFKNYVFANRKLFGVSLISLIALIVALVLIFTTFASCNSYIPAKGNLMKDISTERVDDEELTQDFKNAYSKFMISLASQIVENDKDNSAVSITNVANALALLSVGAEGETKAQLQELLGKDVENFGAQLSTLEACVAKGEKDNSGMLYLNELLINSAISYEISEDFLEENGEFYGLNIHGENFGKDSALKSFQNRNYKLFNGAVFPNISVNKAQYMQISSSASFFGTWKKPISEENVVTDAYIFNNNYFFNSFFKSIEDNYIKGDTFSGVVKEFTNDFSFVGIVPSEREDLSSSYTLQDVMTELASDKNKYRNLLSMKKSANNVAVVLPNYKNSVDTPTTTNLTDVVKKIGVTKIFTKDANLQNIAVDSTNLHLDKLSASGDIVLTPTGHGKFSKDVKPITNVEWKNCKKAVVFDKSFIYFIVDNKSGLPVYFAVVNNLR